ncbi:uncharacterized protein [Atheta coriaria]|uniref:uncharacterized protein n=1 Tax=Dalotia coriaria TaxID=877792 RepID=UPI0031F3E067
MFTNKKYGMKKKKRQQKAEFVCVEPTLRSVYDILLENMQLLQRNIYVHRIIYVGTHTFSETDADNIGKHFRANIEQVNAMYCEEFLTGFLLHYTRHFIHVLDGSEDSIKKHLDLLFSTKETKDRLETVKVLVAYHNINQRFLSSWTELFARPPKLLRRIKSDVDIAEAKNNIIMCIKKLYKLAFNLKVTDEDSSQTGELPSFSSHQRRTSYYTDEEATALAYPLISDNKMMTNYRMSLASSRHQNVIPELQLIEFLVETPHTLDMNEYRKCYGSVPSLFTYMDFAWPVATDFIPRNVFEAEFDPVSDVLGACISELDMPM